MRDRHLHSYIKRTQNIEGYTLIETIVAMALFLSVLIPLVATMGNVMLDRKSVLTGKGLALAVSEMNATASKKDFTDLRKTTDTGLIIQRTVQRSIPLIEVEIIVKTDGELSKTVVVLKRTFIEYQ